MMLAYIVSFLIIAQTDSCLKFCSGTRLGSVVF